MQKLAVLVFLSALSLPLLAANPEDLLFHATFDGTLVARNHAGTAIAPVSGPASPQYVPGRNGTGAALKTGGTDSHVTYPTAGTMSLEAGTIAMWVRPDGWSTDNPASADAHLRHFFNVNAQPTTADPNPGYLSLYKYGQGSVYWLSWRHDPVVKAYVTTPGLTNTAETYVWRDGVWAHLVAT